MKFRIALAGVHIEIDSIYSDVYTMCQDYLTEDAADFFVAIEEADVEFEREKSIREAKYEGRGVPAFSSGYLETLAVYRKIAVKMLDYDAFLMHGAVVGHDGKAYLFTAPSGVGKTTHTRFWLETYPDAYILNGDKPLLRFLDGRFYACGTPWAGKEGMNRNEMLPLAGVAFLFRGKENEIKSVSFENAFPMLITQTYRPTELDALKKTLELIKKLGDTTRFYALACNLDPDAARIAKEGMEEK